MPTFDELRQEYQRARDAYEATREECLAFGRFVFDHAAEYLRCEEGRDVELVEEPFLEEAYWTRPLYFNLPDGVRLRCELGVRASDDYYSVRVSCGPHRGDFPVPRNREGARPITEEKQAEKAEPVYDLLFDIAVRRLKDETHDVLTRQQNVR